MIARHIMTRHAYIEFFLIFHLGFLFFAIMLSSLPPDAFESSLGILIISIVVWYGIYIFIRNSIRRLRSAGFSPWLMLIGLVPVANFALLVLLFKPDVSDEQLKSTTKRGDSLSARTD